MKLSELAQSTNDTNEAVTDKVLTLANLITLARLCLLPLCFYLLLSNQNIAAAVLFAVTASTDFLDGYVARATNTVSRLGQLLDPLVDRALIFTAVLGLLVTGRLPLWMVLLVLARDAYLLISGYILLKHHRIRIPVSYIGKTSMWFLSIGFAGLILNMPQLVGLGIVNTPALPGFSSDPYCFFIWFAYIGLALSLFVAVVYTIRGLRALKEARIKGSDDARAE